MRYFFNICKSLLKKRNTLFRMDVTALCTKYKVISSKIYEEISDFSINTQ